MADYDQEERLLPRRRKPSRRCHTYLGLRASGRLRRAGVLSPGRQEEGSSCTGERLLHGVLRPRKGIKFRGEQVAPGAFHVVRLRWTWDVQRERYREYAYFGDTPVPGPTEQGFVQRALLNPNQAWDVTSSSPTTSRTGPQRHSPKGLVTPVSVLSATTPATGSPGRSWVRHQSRTPTPVTALPRLPRVGETPNRITCGGLGPEGPDGIYWFVETITAREVMDNGEQERPNALTTL